MSDKRYLEKHGKQWRVQVRVPPKLQEVIGKKRLVVPLHTDSLANANRLKFDIVAKLKAEIRAAEKGVTKKTDTITDEALSWRDSIQREKPTIQYVDIGEEEEVPTEYFLTREEFLPERAQEIEAERGAEAAQAFFKIATGEATPITAIINLWLAERKDMKPRQQVDYRRAVTKFSDWLSSANLAATIEAITRKTVGRYISEAMIGIGRHPKTANKDISALSSYWKWLIKRGHIEVNPWSNQSLSKKLAPKSKKRPYTDDEIRRLLSGTNDALLLDAMNVAALSGMRLEEIASLKVSDVRFGYFDIADAKTHAGVRQVPTHSGLVTTVERRTLGKTDKDFLFEELGAARAGVIERGQIITKRFITLRRRLGIEEKEEGQRQSNVDFHSFRRWFITKARDALQHEAKGYDPWTIAEVVGHDTEGSGKELAMTMGVYPAGQSEMAKRACVEAVKMPSAKYLP